MVFRSFPVALHNSSPVSEVRYLGGEFRTVFLTECPVSGMIENIQSLLDQIQI
jgi:hypothetical protein